MTRRSMLGTVGAAPLMAFDAAAEQDGASRAKPGAPAADELRLGIATYSFREFARKTMLKMAKSLHTPYLNLKDVHLPLTLSDKDRDKALKEIRDAGFTILGTGSIDFKTDDEGAFRAKFEYAKKSGIPLLVAAPTKVTLPKLEKYVQEYDVKVAVHNHGPEDGHFPTPQSVLAAVQDMDPRVGLCMDVGHTARTGADVVAEIRSAGSRLLDLHMKDVAILQSADYKVARDSQVDVGEGKLPIPGILRELKRINYRGGVMLEYEISESDPLPGMLRSFGFLRGALAGLRV